MVPKKFVFWVCCCCCSSCSYLNSLYYISEIGSCRLQRQMKSCEQESHGTVATLISSDFPDEKNIKQNGHLCHIKPIHKAKRKERKTYKVHSFFLLIFFIQVLNTETFLLLDGTMTATSVSLQGVLSGGRKESLGIPTQLSSSNLLSITCTSFHLCSCACFKYDEFW